MAVEEEGQMTEVEVEYIAGIAAAAALVVVAQVSG